MSRLKKGRGIILRKLISKPGDVGLVVYSKEMGKIFLLAKGAQKIAGRRLSATDSLNIIDFLYSERENFKYMHEASIVSVLESIKPTYGKRQKLLMVLEMVDKLSPIEQKDEAVYAFVVSFLQKLVSGDLLKEEFIVQMEALINCFGYSWPKNFTKTWPELGRAMETLTERRIYAYEL